MSFRIKLFLAFILFAIFTTSFSIYIFSDIVKSKNLDNQLSSISDILDKKDEKIFSYISNLKDSLYAISKNKNFQDFTESRKNKNYIEDLFKTVLNTRKCIDQIRFLDNTGNEIIRIDRNKKNKTLQNKSDRYYFKKIKQQEIDTVWYSKFDLNVENGKIEFPKKETIRLGLNLERGILIINFNLDELKYIMELYDYNVYLVDKDGNILIDSNEKYSWSKYLNKNIKINNILNQNNLDFLKYSNFSNDKFVLKKLSFQNDDKVFLIIEFPISLSELIEEEMLPVYIVITILTIVVSILLAYYFARPFVNLVAQKEDAYKRLDIEVEKKTKQLSDSLKIIDKYVIRSSTDLDGNIIYVSEAFCKISGFSKQELLGKPHSVVKHPDMDRKVFKDLWETISSGKTWEGLIKNKSKNGGFYWVKAYIEPKFDSEGNIKSYTAIRKNITSEVLLEKLNITLEKRVEEEVQKNIKQLEAMQEDQLRNAKLSSIGALAAGITHEINTPLTYIKGNFEMLKFDIEALQNEDTKNRMIDDINVIQDGLNRIAAIVESMKEVSQISSAIVEDVNIYSTLITALTVSYNNIKQKAKIYINGDEFNLNLSKDKYLFNVKVQKQRIEQVWMVIINNAIDELIKIDNYEERKLDIIIKESKDYLIVKFKDNAGGICEEILDNIFEPFVSTKVHGGMGIGLNIAKKIVADQGGKMLAYNEDDGAVFEVKFNLNNQKS